MSTQQPQPQQQTPRRKNKTSSHKVIEVALLQQNRLLFVVGNRPKDVLLTVNTLCHNDEGRCLTSPGLSRGIHSEDNRDSAGRVWLSGGFGVRSWDQKHYGPEIRAFHRRRAISAAALNKQHAAMVASACKLHCLAQAAGCNARSGADLPTQNQQQQGSLFAGLAGTERALAAS